MATCDFSSRRDIMATRLSAEFDRARTIASAEDRARSVIVLALRTKKQRATDEPGFTQMYQAATLSHPCCICVNPWLRTIS
jgi:hypothetical protein